MTAGVAGPPEPNGCAHSDYMPCAVCIVDGIVGGVAEQEPDPREAILRNMLIGVGILRLLDAVDPARAALSKIIELHTHGPMSGVEVCDVCSENAADEAINDQCSWVAWPCSTVAAAMEGKTK